MADIYWGLAVIGILGMGTFYGSLLLSRKLPRWKSDSLALLLVGIIFFYIRFFWYNTRLVSILPFSNLIVLGNWFPLFAAALGGLAWHRIPGQIFRKSVFVGALASTSTYSLICPLVGDAPMCMNVWRRGICVQTTAKTCTAACGATLLRAYGILATEREMAQLCLTRDGTTWLGLYRGLKIKTAGTQWDVEVLSTDAKQVLKNNGPVIVSVGLPKSPSMHQQMAMSEWGWKQGIGHSVIFLRQTHHGRVQIVDPTPGVGHEEWTAGDVEILYRGTAMRLVKRS